MSVADSVRSVLPSLLAFTTGTWEQWLADFDDDAEQALTPYLEDGVGHPPSAELLRCADDFRALAPVLYNRIDDGRHITSAVENPLLAVPALLDNQIIEEQAIVAALDAYRDFIRDADARSRAAAAPTAASDLLTVLAEYGLYWDLMVEAEVPLDMPFTVKTQEQRVLELGWWSHRGSQPLLLSDAATNHVVLTVNDPNVEILDPRMVSPQGDDLSYFAAATRDTDPEGAVLYLADNDRDYRGDLEFGVRPTRLVRWVGYVFLLIVALPIPVLLVHRPSAADLAVLVLPSTFAASLLLIREPTTLGSSLRRGPTAVLLATLSSLWTIVICFYLADYLRQ